MKEHMSKIDVIFAAINEILDARAKATPGPWKFTPADECDDWMIYNSEFTFVKQDDSGVPVSKEDGEFLVMACNRISALASALELTTVALSNWLNWEKEQIEKEGPYVGKRINELINAGNETIERVAEILEDRK